LKSFLDNGHLPSPFAGAILSTKSHFIGAVEKQFAGGWRLTPLLSIPLQPRHWTSPKSRACYTTCWLLVLTLSFVALCILLRWGWEAGGGGGGPAASQDSHDTDGY